MSKYDDKHIIQHPGHVLLTNGQYYCHSYRYEKPQTYEKYEKEK